MIDWLKDNPFIDTSVIVIALIIIFFSGCQITAPSLIDPTRQVSKTELENELQTLLNTAEMRFKQIAQEETLRRELLNHALFIGQSGTINLYGLIPIAMSLLGAGAVADNVRKRKIIKNNLTTYVKTSEENSGPTRDSA